MDWSTEYRTTVALKDVAAQAAIALLLLTEETRLRKLLMLANLRRGENENVCEESAGRV